MPELPEVERAARRLRPRIVGRTLERIDLQHPSYRRRLTRAGARRAEGRRVLSVERRGKHQVIRLEGDVYILAHFRMSGHWEIASDGPPHRHARAVMHFGDDLRVSLVDSRALGTLTVHDDEADLPRLGMEPLGRQFTPELLAAVLARRRIPIKVALLDQHIVAGVGNIYAAEALWLAKIDPRTPARRLTPPQREALVAAIRLTLRGAGRGTARHGDSSGTRFKVYDRRGRPCLRCGTVIERIIQSQRSTYWCPSCQRPAGTALSAATGRMPRADGRKRKARGRAAATTPCIR